MSRYSTQCLLAICAVVLFALLVCYLMHVNVLLPHRTEAGSKRRSVEWARHIGPEEIDRFIIHTSKSHGWLELKRPEDGPDIDRLWRSVQRIRVVDREAWFYGTSSGQLMAFSKGKGVWMTHGNFDPRHAPVISECQRSDDLAAIVQDIIKRKARPNRD